MSAPICRIWQPSQTVNTVNLGPGPTKNRELRGALQSDRDKYVPVDAYRGYGRTEGGYIADARSTRSHVTSTLIRLR